MQVVETSPTDVDRVLRDPTCYEALAKLRAEERSKQDADTASPATSTSKPGEAAAWGRAALAKLKVQRTVADRQRRRAEERAKQCTDAAEAVANASDAEVLASTKNPRKTAAKTRAVIKDMK
jgi:hypothetical protein